MSVEILQGILDRTEGCLGILLNGLDGFAVEKVWSEEATDRLDHTVAVAEFTSVVEQAVEKNREAGFGELRELTITNEKGTFLIRLLGENQFIAMIMSPDGSIGRGRYELHEAKFLLEHEPVA